MKRDHIRIKQTYTNPKLKYVCIHCTVKLLSLICSTMQLLKNINRNNAQPYII